MTLAIILPLSTFTAIAGLPYYRITRPMPVVEVFGDVPRVPDEMKPAAAISELLGGRSSQERRRVSNAFKQEDTLNNQCPRGAGL